MVKVRLPISINGLLRSARLAGVVVVCWVLSTGCALVLTSSTDRGDLGELAFHEGWRFRWGDPQLSGDPVKSWLESDIDQAAWQVADSPIRPAGRGDSDYLWLAARLPDNLSSRDTVMLRLAWQTLEAYVDGRRIYQFGKIPTVNETARFPGNASHFLPLPPNAGGRVLMLRFHSDGALIGALGGIYLGQDRDLIARLLKGELEQLVLAGVFWLIAAFSFLMFWQNRDVKALLAFSFFTLACGCHAFATTSTKQFLVASPEFWLRVEFLGLYSAPIGICYFTEKFFGAGYKRIIRRIWQACCAFVALAVVGDVAFEVPLWIYLIPYDCLLLVGLNYLIFDVARQARHKNLNARIFGAGLLIASLAGLHDVLVVFGLVNPPVFILAYGVFALIFCLAIVLAREFIAMVQARKNIELGGAVQALLVPREMNGRHEGLAYGMLYRPFDTMSGDWLYVWKGAGGERRLIFGDVMGKGPQAALAVSAIMALLQTAEKQSLSMAKAIELVNGGLLSLFGAHTTTTLAAIVMHGGGDVTIHNCGGVGWFLLSKNVMHHHPCTSSLLGVAETLMLRETRLLLKPGDYLVSFTDGVIDGSRALRILERQLTEGASRPTTVDDVIALVDGTVHAKQKIDDQSIVVVQATDGVRSRLPVKPPAHSGAAVGR